MSPVQPSKARTPRTMVIAIGGLALGVLLVLGLFVFAIPHLTESGKIEVQVGAETFALGNARVKAPLIAQDGPFLFSDPGVGQRDIFVQHLGDDPLTGWTAFDARRPGTGRDCSLVWDQGAGHFEDPCDGTVVAADGAGLPHYDVQVSDQDQLSINLRSDGSGTSTTTAPAVAPTTSIKITR